MTELVFTGPTPDIYVIRHRRTTQADRLAQNGANRTPQAPGLLSAQARSGLRRVDAGAPKALVDVDIAEAADAPLIEQQRLNLPAPPTEQLEKIFFAYFEGIDAKAREMPFERFRAEQAHAAEPPDVVQPELATTVERNPHVRMWGDRIT